MFPISDSTPRRTFPFVNYIIIFLNIYIFIQQLSAANTELFTYQYSFIPSQFHVFDPLSYIPIFTSMFLHGGFLHIILNMWFLHIFGDNVEDVVGHIRYLLLYLGAGLVATLAQYILLPQSTIPMVGASGAISGVAGIYFVFFRRSTVKTLVMYFFFWDIIELPVWFFLGYWFVTQLFSGVGSLVAFDVNRGGIAWFAHIGGFVFGYLIAKGLTPRLGAAERS